MTWVLIAATLCAGVFAGAAIYVNAVEHPARLSCGTELALREFGPSYHRATIMQASLAIAGCVMGLWSAWAGSDAWLASGAILLGAVVPFTLIVILPTNHQLIDPALDPRSQEATHLLSVGATSCGAERLEHRCLPAFSPSTGSVMNVNETDLRPNMRALAMPTLISEAPGDEARSRA